MNGLIKKKIYSTLIVVAVAITSTLIITNTTVLADSTRDDACKGVNYATGGEAGDCTGTGINDVGGWVYTVINWALIVIGIICVVFIIIGAVKFMTSGGEPDKVKSGKNTIMYAVIGLVIAILANVIVQIVFNLTDAIIK